MLECGRISSSSSRSRRQSNYAICVVSSFPSNATEIHILKITNTRHETASDFKFKDTRFEKRKHRNPVSSQSKANTWFLCSSRPTDSDMKLLSFLDFDGESETPVLSLPWQGRYETLEVWGKLTAKERFSFMCLCAVILAWEHGSTITESRATEWIR